MSTWCRPRTPTLAALCFLLGVQVGGAVVYLVQHRGEVERPLYPGIFAVAVLATLGAVDRVVNHRFTQSSRGNPRVSRPPAG